MAWRTPAPSCCARPPTACPNSTATRSAAARIVGNPGCYPTSVQLGLAPLLRTRGLVDASHLIANCASGVSGAGRKAEVGSLFAEAADSFKAYGVKGHRHGPEINEQLRRIAGVASDDASVNCIFVPHLIPSSAAFIRRSMRA